MAEPRRTKRRYGLPWAGYQSSAPPHMVDSKYATSDEPASSRRSSNYRYNPLEGKFYRREGIVQKGSSTGILENGTGELTVARCRQLLSLRSGSLSDGYPTHASLWTEEGNHKGCVHFYNTNTSTDQVLGQEFGTTQYPTATGSPSYFKALPYVRTTDNTIGRFNTLERRAQAAAGSRRVLEVGDELYMPNLTGTPLRWNKNANDNDADTGSVVRVSHVGRPSPLGLPTITTGTINAAGSWHEGDKFYISVAFRFADGSVSMPIIPRPRNDALNYAANSNHTGLGLISLTRSGSGFDDRYYDLTWSTIPIGPADCVGRYLLRTPKLNGVVTAGAAATEGTEPSPLDLRITAYLPNNTQTSYTDSNGNDLGLIDDPLLVRFDHIMQPSARYISTVDGRIVVGYTNPHPVAIYLAPNVNAIDTDTTLDDVAFVYFMTGGTLTLQRSSGNTTAIANIGTKSIQRVVDLINDTTNSDVTGGDVTVTGTGGGKWWACVAPGADASAPCDNTATAAANANLVSVTGATDMAGDGNGVIRGYSPSFPACIFFSSTYLGNFPTQKRRIFFTMGSPGMPPSAACSYAAGNFRTAPESWGDLVGMAPLNNGSVVCFSKAIGVLQNRKAGISGEDEDYRLYELNQTRGCIAWDSIATFNGAVGYLTEDGYVVTDGRDEVIISSDIWNSATQTGEWAYEIGQCREAVASDTDIARFHAKVMSGRLYVGFRLTGTARSAATDAHPLTWMVYDFTGSEQFSGLRGVLRQDGTPWGWSTPLTSPLAVGPFGEVVLSTGVVRYTAAEDSTGLTSNGLIYNIESTNPLDGATNVTATLWTARDLADHLKRKAAQEVNMVYKKNGTGMELNAYRDGEGSSAAATITIPTTGSTKFAATPMPMPQTMRTGARAVEFKVTDTTASSQTATSEVWGLEVDVLLLDSYT